jgi:hypothetical protein
MYRISGGLLVLLMALPTFGGEPGKTQDKPATPSQQFSALQKEYDAAMQAFQKAYGEAKTDAERQKLFQEKYPQPDKFATKFLAIAEENAKDPVALDALVWVMTHSQGIVLANNNSPRGKAMAILTRDHLQSDKLGQVCQTLVYAGDKESEAFLRTLLEKSPHRSVQGQACLSLAQNLSQRQRGKAGTSKEAEELFERAAEKFADVKTPFFGTVGDKAKSELFEIRFLAVGKTAPDIDGEDQDGKKFKLSDYRGKVVLLDFWSQF